MIRIMKNQLTALAIMLLLIGPGIAAPPAQITLGAPHRKVFPAENNNVPASVYFEVPAKITNISKEAISFGTNGGPDFIAYVRLRKNDNHWTDISFKGGMCGLGRSVQTLAPGESTDSTVLVDLEYSGHGYRLALRINPSGSNSKSGTRIVSPSIVLP